MATYYDIHGQKVEYLSSDPSPVTEGQVWYNSTAQVAKFRGVTTSNTWASGANHPQGGPGRYISYSSGTGTQTAALSAGGYSPTISGSYEYDGSAWTTGGAMPAVGYSGQMIIFMGIYKCRWYFWRCRKHITISRLYSYLEWISFYKHRSYIKHS